jgi:hypothetical protein
MGGHERSALSWLSNLKFLLIRIFGLKVRVSLPAHHPHQQAKRCCRILAFPAEQLGQCSGKSAGSFRVTVYANSDAISRELVSAILSKECGREYFSSAIL